MKIFQTYFEEPYFYGDYDQTICLQFDGTSVTGKGVSIYAYFAFLDANKQLIGLERSIYLFVNNRVEPDVYFTGIYNISLSGDNLQNVPDNAKYLRVQVRSEFGQVFAEKLFRVKQYCSAKDKVALNFYNSLAGLDTFVFNANVIGELTVKETSAIQRYAARNKEVVQKKADWTLQLTSSEVTEKQIEGLSEIINSEEVYLNDKYEYWKRYRQVINDVWIPVVVETTKLTFYQNAQGFYDVTILVKLLENA